MHNFPEGSKILCNKIHNIKEAKEILKLCIDHDVRIDSTFLDDMVDTEYPRIIFNGGKIVQSGADPNDYATVSLEEFKNFLQGKGDEKKISMPFSESIELSEYTAIVTKKNIKVGCKSFSHEQITKLYNLSQKAQKAKK